MAPTALCVVLLLLLASHCQAQDLASYENSKILINGQYELYWTYRAADSRMDMAVRVKTLGWFGLGISPDGQMSNSDVVTGWVTAGGMAMLQVSGLQMIGWCTPHVRLLTNGSNYILYIHSLYVNGGMFCYRTASQMRDLDPPWTPSRIGLWLQGGRRTDGPLWPSAELSRLVIPVTEILFRCVCPQQCGFFGQMFLSAYMI